MKLIFAGTPEFAVPTLQTLLDSQHEVVAAYTQPDRPAGRGRSVRASPIKILAEQQGVPVIQPQTLKDELAAAELKGLHADLMVVVAYGLILPVNILEIPRFGCLNVHASLLPRWRGAAPIQRSILAGDTETGITIMQMDVGLDTGDMLKRETVRIMDETTAQELHDELASLGADALLQVVEALDRGEPPEPEQQDDTLATYAEKLNKQEAQINWNLPSREIMRQVKAFNPWPVSFTRQSGKTLRVWDACLSQASKNAQPGTLINIEDDQPVIACGSGALKLLEVQPEGKKRMPAKAYMNARKAELKPGLIFGQ